MDFKKLISGEKTERRKKAAKGRKADSILTISILAILGLEGQFSHNSKILFKMYINFEWKISQW